MLASHFTSFFLIHEALIHFLETSVCFLICSSCCHTQPHIQYKHQKAQIEMLQLMHDHTKMAMDVMIYSSTPIPQQRPKAPIALKPKALPPDAPQTNPMSAHPMVQWMVQTEDEQGQRPRAQKHQSGLTHSRTETKRRQHLDLCDDCGTQILTSSHKEMHTQM